MKIFLIFCAICSTQSSTLFQIQDTLTVLCSQFPLLSAINDTSLQCARLRLDANVSSSNFDLNNPSQLLLFILLDVSSSVVSPINIAINLNPSADSPSTVEEVRIVLLITEASFTINNQTNSIYSTYDIPILHWNNSESNVYELIDVVHLNISEYGTERSLCYWNDLFNSYSSSQPAYVYFLKTTSTDLAFILTETKDLPAPSLYLNILYCIPYRLGTTELVLIICSVVLFISFLVIVCVAQCLKDEDNLRGYFQRRKEKKSNSSSSDTSDSTVIVENDDTITKY